MEYKHDRYILNILCEFNDKKAELDFMEYEKTVTLIVVKFSIFLMGITFAMFTLSDYYYTGEESSFRISLGLRLLALCITAVAFTLAGRFRHYHQTLIMITFTELAVFIIYLLNLYYQKSTQPALQFMSMMLLILAVFLIPNRWKNCLIAGSTMLVTYIIFCLIFQKYSGSPSLFQRGIYLFICLASCAIFLFGRERSMRKHFAAEQLLNFISITDRLTGIYNRGRFEYILGLWIKNMRHDPFCLVFFDIDNFKSVNDTYGHAVGDQVLVGLAEAVTASIRDDDVFARWGGEEFVILFGETSIEQAKEQAERVRLAAENKPFAYGGQVTVSIGVVQYRRGETLVDLVNRADMKMYKAKEAGKNRVVAEIPEEETAEAPQ